MFDSGVSAAHGHAAGTPGGEVGLGQRPVAGPGGIACGTSSRRSVRFVGQRERIISVIRPSRSRLIGWATTPACGWTGNCWTPMAIKTSRCRNAMRSATRARIPAISPMKRRPTTLCVTPYIRWPGACPPSGRALIATSGDLYRWGEWGCLGLLPCLPRDEREAGRLWPLPR